MNAAPGSPPADRSFTMSRVDKVVEGAGSAERLGRHLRSLQGDRIAVLTSPSVRRSGFFDPIVDGLAGRAISVLDQVRPHNRVTALAEIVDTLVSEPPDLIVAVGGGSVVDAAKLSALAVARGERDASALVGLSMGRGEGRALSIPGRVPTVVAVPTTLAGSEWNGYAGAVDERGTKVMIGHVRLTPSVVVLDPVVAGETPVDLWIQSGVRTLDHAIEGLHSRRSHVVSSALSLEAIRAVASALPNSRGDHSDPEATASCFRATWMAAVYMHNAPMGLSHAIGHQLGVAGVPHGATSSIVLPHVLRFLERRAPEVQTRIRDALHEAGAGGSTAAEALETWLDGLDVPRTLRGYEIDETTLDTIAAAVVESPLIDMVPGPVSVDDVRAILSRAW